MTQAGPGGDKPRNPLRIVIWGAALALLLLPAVAMRFTSEVDWSGFDFVVFGAMLLFVCGGYELATRVTGNQAYRLAAGIALLGAFLLTWINLAVGIVGNEANPLNLLFFAIPLAGMAGGLVARFRPRGMAWALVAAAIAQVLVAVVALLAGGEDAIVVFGLTGFFVLVWLSSALLFRKAAQERVPPA